MSEHLPFHLVAAPFTPFDANGALQLETIVLQAAHLQQNGVSGAFVCGTTGESASLTLEERKQVAARWREVAGELELLVHVGHTVLEEARALAAHAQEIGAAGIAATAPFYFKTLTPVGAVDWCAQIASAAPQTPFFYYHIPSMTGVDFSVAAFVEEAREQIPSFAGLKFTHENLFDFGLCLDVAPDLRHFFGRDEILLAGLALGARGAVGSTYNFAAPLFRRLVDAFEAGDLETARAEQRRARTMIRVLVQNGGIPAMKALMKECGVDCGPCRAPLARFGHQETAKLRGELEKIGFFEWGTA